LLATADGDARTLLAAAETDWERPVTQCPGWDTADLVRHTGGIFEWMAAIAASGARVSRHSLDPAPADPVDLPAWYLDGLHRVVSVLGSADPDTRTWTFSTTGDGTVRWWCRRLAVEVAIHRWDAQDGATAASGPGRSTPQPLDGAVAAAGIGEFVVEFLPGLLTRDDVEGLTGLLHLYATDGPGEWWVDLDRPGVAPSIRTPADLGVRGTRSDLLLWLTNRLPLPTIEVVGDDDVAVRWGQLRR